MVGLPPRGILCRRHMWVDHVSRREYDQVAWPWYARLHGGAAQANAEGARAAHALLRAEVQVTASGSGRLAILAEKACTCPTLEAAGVFWSATAALAVGAAAAVVVRALVCKRPCHRENLHFASPFDALQPHIRDREPCHHTKPCVTIRQQTSAMVRIREER